jgi:hypothetical protein
MAPKPRTQRRRARWGFCILHRKTNRSRGRTQPHSLVDDGDSVLQPLLTIVFTMPPYFKETPWSEHSSKGHGGLSRGADARSHVDTESKLWCLLKGGTFEGTYFLHVA